MRTLVIAAVVAAGLGLSGCGDGTPEASAAVAPSSAASPTMQTASVQQYAGIANSSIKSMRETWTAYKDDGCPIDDSEIRCSADALTLDIQAQTLVKRLDGAAKPGVPAFIGDPPAELVGLVQETIEKAQAVDDSVDESGDIVGGGGALFQSGGSLMTTLDKWDPYI
jgi:hypothetical protein